MKIVFLLVCILLLSPKEVFAQSSITINEFIVHPSPGGREWIELYNPNGAETKGFWVDDDNSFANDSGNAGKKSFESVQNSTGQYVVLDLTSALFNNTGDVVVLFDASGNIIDQVEYGEDPRTDVPIGRTPNGTGDFYLLASATKGSANSGPQPTQAPEAPPTAKPQKAVQEVQGSSVTARPTSSSQSKAKAVATRTPTPIKISVTPKIASASAKVASRSAMPTAVLGAKTVTTDKDILPKPTDKVFGPKSSSASPMFVMLGGLSIIGCGILMYFKKWRKK